MIMIIYYDYDYMIMIVVNPLPRRIEFIAL